MKEERSWSEAEYRGDCVQHIVYHIPIASISTYYIDIVLLLVMFKDIAGMLIHVGDSFDFGMEVYI